MENSLYPHDTFWLLGKLVLLNCIFFGVYSLFISIPQKIFFLQFVLRSYYGFWNLRTAIKFRRPRGGRIWYVKEVLKGIVTGLYAH